MLTVFEFDQSSGDFNEISLEDMRFERVKWINCVNPSEAEMQTLAEKISVSPQSITSALDADQVPITTEEGHFSKIVIRAPLRKKGVVVTTSFTILLSEHLIVTFSAHDIDVFRTFMQKGPQTHRQILQRGTPFLLKRIIEEVTIDFFRILDTVESQIDRIETHAIYHPDQNTVKEIFGLQKTLIFFHKAFSGNRDVISNIEREDVEHVPAESAKEFASLFHKTVQLSDQATTYREILTETLEVYASSVSNNLNVIMKRMTAYGSIILVPTLISGIYGMNFHVLPEVSWKYGYAFALGLMVVSVAAISVYFKRKGYF
ncbi:MAG: magnesium/cobalt transporter CorA [Nanoarchaeota archaeon]